MEHGNLQSTRQWAEGVNRGTADLDRFDQGSWKRSQVMWRSQVLSREGRQLLCVWKGALILDFKHSVLMDRVSRGRCWAGIQQG